MKKAIILVGKYLLLAASVLLVMAGISFVAPDGNIAYLFGASLFPAAVAWFAIKRSRAKRAAPALPESKVSLLSMAMWAVSVSAIIAGRLVLELLGAQDETIAQSTGWLSVFGGLCAYWFADWLATLIDRKSAST